MERTSGRLPAAWEQEWPATSLCYSLSPKARQDGVERERGKGVEFYTKILLKNGTALR